MPELLEPFDKARFWSGLSPDERGRQEVILEFLTTESNYLGRLLVLRNLCVDHQLFYTPSQVILSVPDREALFQNLPDLIRCSEELLNTLLAKRDPTRMMLNALSITFYTYIHNFECFKTYCIGHAASTARLRSLLTTNKNFAKFVKNNILLPECSGLDIDSFLLEPVQRLARYPLLLRQILHFTPKHHSDHLATAKALQVGEEFLHDTNEAVRNAENRAHIQNIKERLSASMPSKIRSLSGLGSFGQVTTPPYDLGELDLLSETKKLGPRLLIYQGPLLKQPGKRKLEAFLFNDLLILCKPYSNGKLELYKKPLPLEELLFSVLDSHCFKLNCNDLELILDAGENLENWNEEMGVAQRASIGVPPRRFSKPTLQHYIGSMEVHLMSGKGLNQSHPELRESPFYCCLELGYQSVESRQQKGPSPMWDQKFILSLADFEEELNGSIHIARRYAPAVFVGKFKLPLGFLEYCGGSKPSLTHLDLTSSLGLQTGQLTLKITFKQF